MIVGIAFALESVRRFKQNVDLADAIQSMWQTFWLERIKNEQRGKGYEIL